MTRKRTNIPTSYYYGCRADLFAKEAEKAAKLAAKEAKAAAAASAALAKKKK